MRSYILLKPDGALRSDIVARILRELATVQQQIIGDQTFWVTPGQMASNSKIELDTPLGQAIWQYLSSGLVRVLVFEGPNAVDEGLRIRTIIRRNYGADLRPYDGVSVRMNLLHAPETEQEALLGILLLT